MATKPGSKSSISDRQPSIFRKRFRVQTPAAETLPEEIIEEILLKLPVSSLLRFTCVSKSWRSLISSKNFIGAHLKVSRKDTNFTHHKIFATTRSSDFSLGLKQCSLPPLFSGLEYNAVDVDCQIKNIVSNAHVVGSCNGLVCLLINSRDIYLLNPSTRKYKKLPDVDSIMMVKYGFGFDESSEDYKVLAAYYDESSFDESSFTVKMKMKIYSLRTDSWKRIEGFESSLLFENGLFENGLFEYGRLPSTEVKALKFVNGNLHWCKRSHVEPNFRWYIVSFDLGSEICRRVAPPDNVEDGYSISLEVIGGCLCVFHPETNNFDVWVMKEYGVSESWAKMVTVPRSSIPSSPCYELVCIGPKGEILFNYRGLKFLLYNPRDNRLRSPDMRDFTNYMEVLHYCESLVPLD